MVGDQQYRLVLSHRAAAMDGDSQKAAQLLVIPVRKRPRHSRAHKAQTQLHRHQRHGEYDESQKDQSRTQFPHRYLLIILFQWDAIKLQAVIDELVAKFPGNRFLKAFDLLIAEFNDLAGAHVNEVVVML